MEKKNFEIIEHTADIGIRVRARDLKELFKIAGIALFQISTQRLSPKKEEIHKMQIRQRADNVEDLFVNWLNELLSLSAVEGLIFEDYIIESIDEKHIEAIGLGYPINDFKVNTEIKAATYHELKVVKEKDFWQAEVIFDV